MASEEFSEGSEAKRPNVQVGDPFLEKLLLEACLDAMQTGAIIGIQDMGAAGLTCSTCEMGARGQVGIEIELDRVPQRETGMTPYEIMLSESQERMLLVAQKGREGEVFRVFEKWGLDAVEIGRVTSDNVMRVREHGQLVAEIPNQALTDDAPLYKRPLQRWEPPVPRETQATTAETSASSPTKFVAVPASRVAICGNIDRRRPTMEGPGRQATAVGFRSRVQNRGPARGNWMRGRGAGLILAWRPRHRRVARNAASNGGQAPH